MTVTPADNMGLFDKVDLQNIDSVNERIASVDIAWEMENLFCFPTEDTIIYVSAEQMKAQSYAAIGSNPTSALEKDTYAREVAMSTKIWGIPVGVTQEAADLAARRGRKIGTLDYQIEKAFKAMKKNVECFILYTVLKDMGSTFTTIEGSTTHRHYDCNDVAGKITWAELQEWFRHMTEHGVNPSFILAGHTMRIAILEELSQVLHFASPQAAQILGGDKDGAINVGSGVTLLPASMSKFMPDAYMIIGGKDFGPACAIDHVHPIEVRKSTTDPFYQTAKFYHNYGVKIVYNEELFVVYNGGGTYSSYVAPSASTASTLFPWMSR